MFFVETLLVCPLLTAIFLVVFPIKDERKKQFALWGSLIPLPISLLLWICLDQTNFQIQNVVSYIIFSRFNLSFTLGIDGISAPLVSLTCFLCPLCILLG